MALLPAEGLLVTAAGDPAIGEVIKGAACRMETYGIDEEADWQAEQIHMTGALLSFDVFRRRKKMGTIRSPLAGRHNLKNTLAVIALAYEVGVPWEKIVEGVLRFEGIKRRQEIVGKVRDILIIDDFAHHPTAISETLMALRLRYPTRRLWAVFEPRSATSRRNVFQKEFVAALALADRIILADIFAPEKIPAEDRLNPEKIISDLVALGKERPVFIDPRPDRLRNGEGAGAGRCRLRDVERRFRRDSPKADFETGDVGANLACTVAPCIRPSPTITKVQWAITRIAPTR
ncbi:MAG: Mur ligase family protein [Candidatus Manganitrophus sp.]|nr:Mur ligase family protein [Candidatus Manganitrophus sp.]